MKPGSTLEENSINDWGLTYNTDWRLTQKKKEQRKNFPVYLCIKCNRSHETERNEYKKEYFTNYYDDYPTIGLKRKNCIECR
jgi:hypothetical protein